MSAILNENIKHLKESPVYIGTYLLTNPHLLYLSKNQSDLYINLVKSKEYNDTIKKPLRALLKKKI
jgi:hypothetical protein